jgi:hypothetical protein
MSSLSELDYRQLHDQVTRLRQDLDRLGEEIERLEHQPSPQDIRAVVVAVRKRATIELSLSAIGYELARRRQAERSAG